MVQAPKIRFYVGVPLYTADGYCLGTLCAIDDRPQTLSDRQRHHLLGLAKQVERHIHWRTAFLAQYPDSQTLVSPKEAAHQGPTVVFLLFNVVANFPWDGDRLFL